MLKDNKGITLISLVITIIVLIILASVATVYGTSTIKYIKFNNAKSQIQTMQSNVNFWYEEAKNNSLNYGLDISAANLNETKVANTLVGGTGSNIADGFKYFSSDYIKNNLNIDGITYDFLINISKRTVCIYGGVEYQDEMYYSAEDFGINAVEYDGMYGEVTFNTTIENGYIIVYNINFSNDIKISKYDVQYQLHGEKYWNTATTDMKKSYVYASEQSGEKVKDDNAWYIPIEEFWTYNIKIKTSLENLNKSDSISTGYVYKNDANGRKTIVTNGVIELKIGDYINYNAAVTQKDENGNETYISYSSPTGTCIENEYSTAVESPERGSGYSSIQTFSCDADTQGWRVLGVNENTGEILIVSAEPVNNKYKLIGFTRYQYGVQELNSISEIYGHGEGATGARSINIDDVNKITGYNPNNTGVYDPEQTGSGTKYGENTVSEYGNEVKYSWTSTANRVLGLGTNGVTATGSKSDYATYLFNWYDPKTNKWKSSKQDTTNPVEITTLTSSYYYYYPYSLNTDSSITGEQKGLSTTSEGYSTIFCDNKSYWLASSYIYDQTSYVAYGLRYVGAGGVVRYNSLYNSYGQIYTPSYTVRPVVSLKSGIKLQWDSSNTRYDIIG